MCVGSIIILLLFVSRIPVEVVPCHVVCALVIAEFGLAARQRFNMGSSPEYLSLKIGRVSTGCGTYDVFLCDVAGS